MYVVQYSRYSENFWSEIRSPLCSRCLAEDPCDVNAECEPTKTGTECTCKDGYIGDGFTCGLAPTEYTSAESSCYQAQQPAPL